MTDTVMIFRQALAHCPRRPEGFKWFGYRRSRYASCGWGFDTADKAIEYLRHQYAREKLENPQWLREFWAEYNKRAGEVESHAALELIRYASGAVSFHAEETTSHASGRAQTRVISISIDAEEAKRIANFIFDGNKQA